MRICFVAPDAYAAAVNASGTHIGGAETQQFQFAQALHSKGYEVSFIVARPSSCSKEDDENLPAWVEVAYSLRDKSSKIGFFRDTLRMYQVIKKIHADIFIQRCSFHDAPRVWLFAKILGAKFIFWVGADFNVNRIWIKHNLSLLRRMAYEYVLSRADEIVVQTENQKMMLNLFYAIKASIIRNIVGIPHSQLRNKRASCTLKVVWGGRINPNKNPGKLLEIARKASEWSFIIAAIKDRNWTREYVEFIKNATHLDNVTIFESTPHKDYLKITNDADIVLNTSRFEGYPNTLLEAFAHGVPALTLGVNPVDVISKYELGWVCDDVDDAVSKLISLAENPDELKKSGEAAFRYVKKFHSREMVTDELERLLMKRMSDD